MRSFNLSSQTQMYSVYNKNKTIGLAVSIHSEGTVYNTFNSGHCPKAASRTLDVDLYLDS